MMTSYLSMGDKEVGQPKGEVVSRSVGVGKAEGLLSRGIRNLEVPTSSTEVVLVVQRSISWHDGLAEGLMGNC